MKHRFICLLLLICHSAHGAFERTNQGGRSMALGGATVSLPRNVWATFLNPAVLPTIEERYLSLSYLPEQFGLKELARGAVSYVEPTPLGTFSLAGQRFGFELYREVTISLAYGRSFSDALYAGLIANYYSLSIQNYGSAGALGIDVGALMKISEQVWWGVAATNVNAPTIGEAEERLPQEFSTGVTYLPIDDSSINLALVKDVRFTTEFRIGVEYTVFDGVDIRGGMSGEPPTLNAGLGLRYSFVQLDYAFTEHPDLGVGHTVSLSLALGGL